MCDGAKWNSGATWTRAFCLILATLSFAGGCATAPLGAARTDFYRGDFANAEALLSTNTAGETDQVLVLMERGMIRQQRQEYEASTKDWMEAAALGEKLDYYSLSKGTASFAVNDQVLAFRGAPYERTLLRAFAAKSYLALGLWDDAAVEARNVIARLENLYGFPDDAYSHYLAGFCLEMANDPEGAAFQYRLVNKTAQGLLTVGEYDGRITVGQTNAPNPLAASPGWERKVSARKTTELVCFVSIGRVPTIGHHGAAASAASAPYAEIYDKNVYLGRTYPFSHTGRLLAETQKRLAALKALKTATRVAAKEAVSEAVSQKNQLLGEILRLILFALEAPDTRQWETLPEWLEIGRMTCPADLKSYRVVFKNGSGTVVGETVVDTPLTRRDNTFVSFCRRL